MRNTHQEIGGTSQSKAYRALRAEFDLFWAVESKRRQTKRCFLELALRGYDLSKLRDEQTTAEIVKIG